MEMDNREGHRKRLKNRFLASGFDGFNDYEVVELLLFFAIPRKDSKPIAKELIKHFGSFSALLDANIDELQTIRGVGRHAAFLISSLRAFFYYYSTNKAASLKKIKTPTDAKGFLSESLKLLDKEAFFALFLNPDNEIVGFKKLFEGTINQSAVYPREIASEAIRLKSTNVIFAHNHIGSNCSPSTCDLQLTKALTQSLKSIELNVLDHIIVSKNDIFSFAENGLIEKT